MNPEPDPLRPPPHGFLLMLTASLFFAAMTAGECHTALVARSGQAHLLPSVLFGLILWLWWPPVTGTLWLLAKRWPALLHFTRKSSLLHTLAGALLGWLHLLCVQGSIILFSRWWAEWRDAYSALDYLTPYRLIIEVGIYGLVFALSGFVYAQAQGQRETVRRLQLERQLTEAQLKALQMQMEPHFLFNTLNALASLVAQGRNAEAGQTLGHLNTILRTTLARRAPEKVPFREELQMIESYLAIQKVRFADRLTVRMEASAEALEGLVPCFLLQPIVENAVQHGIAASDQDGLIEATVRRVGDRLCLQVRDNGPGPSPETRGHGIGLRNTRERLAYFYPGAHEFSAAPLGGSGYEVTIQIPWERGAL